MKVAVVILSWNNREFLKEFLPGVVASSKAAQVVVADNGSTDGTVEYLKEEFPEVKVLAFDKNYGFTGGYNKAIALLEEYEYVLLLNSDIETPAGWLEPLTAFMETNPDCGICAPKLHALQDKDRFEYAGAAGGFIDRYGFPFCRGRVLKWTEQDNGQFGDSPADVFWATGACILVRTSLWKALGGLDSRFFAHMEEIDFCWRAKLAGWRVCVVPESVVYHLGGGTLRPDSPGKLKLNYRNNLLMLRNNLSKTFALSYRNAGLPAEKAAAKGRRKAGRRIFSRMILDGVSAAIFLLTGRASNFKAVVKAHNEYRELVETPSAQEIENWLNSGAIPTISGIYNGCIPAAALIWGKKTFGKLQPKIK